MFSIEFKVIHRHDLLNHPHKEGCGWGSGCALFKCEFAGFNTLCMWTDGIKGANVQCEQDAIWGQGIQTGNLQYEILGVLDV